MVTKQTWTLKTGILKYTVDCPNASCPCLLIHVLMIHTHEYFADYILTAEVIHMNIAFFATTQKLFYPLS